MTRLRAAISKHGWLIAIACVYLYVFPYFPKLGSANELPRVFLVKAMVHDQTFAIDRGVERWRESADLADISESGGHQYSNKAPGSAMLAAPVYAAVNAIAGEPSLVVSVWLCRITTGVVPTLMFLVLLYGFLARFAPDPAIRKLVLVAYALGSMAMTYSMLYFSHQLAAVCIASAMIFAIDVLDGKRGLGSMVVAGALAGAAPLIDYQAAFAGIPLAVYVVARTWRDVPRLARVAGCAALGAAGPIAILLAYHQACFGSPWRTGYDASVTFAIYHQQGFLGLTALRWKAFIGSTLSFDNGLVTLSPWLLLAVSGTVELMRRPRESGVRGITMMCVAISITYLLFISAINFWRGGGAVGPRYITVLVPFLLPMVAAQLEAVRDRPRFLGAVAGTIIVSIVIYTLSTATFPYWPEVFKNPFRDVTLRMLSDDLVAPNLASAIGISGVLGLVPYVALIGGITGWAIVRIVHWQGLAVATGVALVMLVTYCLVPGGSWGDGYDYVRAIVTWRSH
jgi:hypothetical protein